MRSVNASFSAAIAEGTVKVAELFILTLADGTIYRYTSHDKDIVWDAGDNTYSAIVIGRDPILFANNFESGSVRVVIGNINGDIYNDVQGNILEAVKVTIKRILWDDTYAADKEIIVFVGFADIEFNRQVLILDCKPIADSLNIKIPRHIYEEPCNYSLFGYNCGLSRDDYNYDGTATGGTTLTLIDTTRGTVYKVNFDNGDEDNPVEIDDALSGGGGGGTGVCINIIYLTATTGTVWYVEQGGAQFVDDEILTGGGNAVTVNGTPAEDTSYHEQGELKMTSGDNSGLRRPVLSNSVNTVTVLWPFPNAVANGDTYEIYPGCDKQGVTCRERFNNEENFRGFLYIPKVEETIM